jgi:hypothetical protein
MTTKRITHWFWAWDDEKEEAWLSKMAKEGLHLKSIGAICFYDFEVGEPRNDVYRLDYILDRKDYPAYLQLFRDAGWEHIGEMGGWQYFRTHAQDSQVPEIYTDKDSKALKYQRVIITLTVFLPILMMFAIRPVSTDSHFAELYMAGKFIMSLFLILYAYAIIRIFGRMQQLKKK